MSLVGGIIVIIIADVSSALRALCFETLVIVARYSPEHPLMYSPE